MSEYINTFCDEDRKNTFPVKNILIYLKGMEDKLILSAQLPKGLNFRCLSGYYHNKSIELYVTDSSLILLNHLRDYFYEELIKIITSHNEITIAIVKRSLETLLKSSPDLLTHIYSFDEEQFNKMIKGKNVNSVYSSRMRSNAEFRVGEIEERVKSHKVVPMSFLVHNFIGQIVECVLSYIVYHTKNKNIIQHYPCDIFIAIFENNSLKNLFVPFILGPYYKEIDDSNLPLQKELISIIKEY